MATRMQRLRRWLPLALGLSLLVLATIVAYAASRRDEGVLEVLAALPWWTLPLALLCHVAAHMMWGARVALLGAALGDPLPAHRAWATVTAGTFGGAVTPGRIGGEGLKLVLLMRRRVPAARASRLLLVDRAFDLLFFVILGSLAVILLPRHLGAEAGPARLLALSGTLVLLAFLTLLVAVLASPGRTTRAMGPLLRLAARLGRRDPDSLSIRALGFVEELRAGLLLVARRRPAYAAAGALLTCANWIIEYAALWTLLAGFGHLLPYHLVFAAAAVLTLVSNIPVTPGGTGVAEGSALLLLSPLAPGISPLFVVAWRGVTYYYDLLVGGSLAAWLLARPIPQAGRGAGEGAAGEAQTAGDGHAAGDGRTAGQGNGHARADDEPAAGSGIDEAVTRRTPGSGAAPPEDAPRLRHS